MAYPVTPVQPYQKATPRHPSGVEPQRLPNAFAERLFALNRSPQSLSDNSVHIDTVALLALALGNPAHTHFSVEEKEGEISFTITRKDLPQKDCPVARARLYRDPVRGGVYLRPDVEESYQGLGLGILTYLVAGRIAHISLGIVLHSNSWQLSPRAKAVWNSLCEQGFAYRRKENDYSLHDSVSRSQGTANLLEIMLKFQIWATVYQDSFAHQLAPIEPDILRRNRIKEPADRKTRAFLLSRKDV